MKGLRRIAMALLLAPSGALAACPDDAAVAALAADMLADKAHAPLRLDSLEDGRCAQAKLVPLLATRWGPPVGYKAALTSPAAQARFKVDQPVRGVLLREMLLPSGAKVPANFTWAGFYEADLLVVIADADVNDARSPEDVLAHIRAIRPFIELPGLVVPSPEGIDGAVVASINAGARLGVMGDEAPVDSGGDWITALASMEVVVTDGDGGEIARAPGRAVLGHPLNAVLWLRDDGVRFKAGDLVSVGSFGPPLKPAAGLAVTVTYRGLPGDPSATVTFE